ncbi:unnamed protein product [Fraxinus pennsylvanica]|uniref:Uncharacterized protein n=1 Tax=Fraxinus pennsylvanica TaxID=56036 RepID=A0AAD2EB49_9LAMI|nr:unnamed protein product [Fraxinus pennsylvanica]
MLVDGRIDARIDREFGRMHLSDGDVPSSNSASAIERIRMTENEGDDVLAGLQHDSLSIRGNPLRIPRMKIIGVRFFSNGHEASSSFGGIAGGINQTIEFKSLRDADGHGTHTALTAAGRHAFKASMEGYASGIAKGMAPKARGIFVSSSAGNDGSNGMSVTNLAPWLTTVGGGTIDRDFPADVILGNERKIRGAL